MKFALDIPITGEYTIENVINLAQESERSGWDGFFLWDVLLDAKEPKIPTLDPTVTLASVALATKKIKLGLMLTPIARRRPWKLARELVTIDHLSKGRLIAGIGLGFNKEDFRAFGENEDDKVRAEKLDESLEILVGLLSGQNINFTGKHYRVTNVTFNPQSYQKPRIPIWLGGFWPHKKPFRRAAKFEGMYAGMNNPTSSSQIDTMTPKDLKEIREYISNYRDSMDRFDFMHYGDITADYNKEKENLQEWEKAGLTWWSQGNDFNSYQEHRERILEGPPKKSRNN